MLNCFLALRNMLAIKQFSRLPNGRDSLLVIWIIVKYFFLQEPTDGSPNYLIVEIWLPGIKTCSKITLDVGEDRLVLRSQCFSYQLFTSLKLILLSSYLDYWL